MKPYYSDDSVTLYHGDCLDVLRELPDASVDAVVTDPPYGLEFMGREWDAPWKSADLSVHAEARTLRADEMGDENKRRFIAAGVNKFQAGKPFQDWCELWAIECLRVLKPGGHLLAFGGSRTWHRLTCAVEDAGFEIRDSIAWLYGSGFPKSLDVSKAIDKARDDNPERRAVGVWLRAQREAAGLLQKDVARHWPSATGGLTGCVANWEGGFNCPTWEQWLKLRELIGFGDEMDAEVWRLNGRKGTPGEAWEKREKVGERDVPIGHAFAGSTYGGDSSEKRVDITAPATREAEAWQGWGTALKPAFEPIVVARKPLAGTVAGNVLAHGTGALNIDGCRVGTDERVNLPAGNKAGGASLNMSVKGMPDDAEATTALGRWPANVVLDETQAAELDKQSGDTTRYFQAPRKGDGKSTDGTVFGQHAGDGIGYAESGGASRFFPTFKYEPKAPTTERPRDGQTAHPTVKPLDLMRWLVRLVTPPGGVVLEPFAGSGTTAEACVVEGFRCIAIEREADYLPLIVQRLTKPIQVALDFT